MALPGPFFHMHSRMHPRFSLRSEGLIEILRVLTGIRTLHVALENRGVPHIMKIRRVGMIVFVGIAAKETDRNAVAAFIVVRGGVKRDVQIADEMDEVSRGFRSFAWIGLGIFQDGELLADGLGD